MDKHADWLRKLEDDLIEQFRGKANTSVFLQAVAHQFKDVYRFYYQLHALQWLDEAQGAQLDGIGNIVDLSRTDALVWANLAGQHVPMEDDLYRLYLLFKIFLNTSECTYSDIMRVVRMFWRETPVYYAEDVEHPATIFLTLARLVSDDEMRVLDIVSKVKAAGVALHFMFGAAHAATRYHAGAMSELTVEHFTDV